MLDVYDDDDEEYGFVTVGLDDIRQAMAARLSVVPDFDARAYIPDSINVPGCFIEPDRPFVDYQMAYETGQILWHFQITVLVNRMVEEVAQQELSKYLHPRGPIVKALQSMVIDDDLLSMTSYCNVMTATRYGAYELGGTTYLGAQLQVTVGS